MLSIWEETKKLGIHIVDNDIGGLGTIPDGHAMIAANEVQKMVYWIAEEFFNDCKKNPDIWNLEKISVQEQQDFILRNKSRVLSYVTQVCLLEGILQKEYGITVEMLKELVPSVEADDLELQKRKEELKDLKLFRDKVAAHTAFSDPRRDDNSAQQLKSLTDLLSVSFDKTHSADSFGMGYINMIVGGQKANHETKIILRDIHPKILNHLNEWTKMFSDLFTPIYPSLPLKVGNKEYRR